MTQRFGSRSPYEDAIYTQTQRCLEIALASVANAGGTAESVVRTRILLVAFDYPQEQMSGPPFAVTEAEVRALYGEFADVRLLATEDVLDENPRFRQRGVSRLVENIFLLTLR